MSTTNQSQFKMHVLEYYLLFIQASQDRKYKASTTVRDLLAKPIKEEMNGTKKFGPDNINKFEVSIL